MLFYIDECLIGETLGLGCVCLKEGDFEPLDDAALDLKKSLRLEHQHRLKFSLGNDDKVEKEQKEILKKTLGAQWLTEFRIIIAKFISTQNLIFAATLHEDYRSVKPFKDSLLDFYLNALSQILNDVLDVIACKQGPTALNIIVVDKPPQMGRRLTEKIIHEYYCENLYRGMKKLRFLDTIMTTSGKHSAALQLVDFYIGALVTCLKFIKQGKPIPTYLIEIMKTIKSNFHDFNCGDKVLGIKLFHLRQSRKEYIAFLNSL